MILSLRGPAPFIGCLDRFEREWCAAIYVSACVQLGDLWQPISWISWAAEAQRLGTLDPCPPWLAFARQFNYTPDVYGLVDGGYFVTRGEGRSLIMEATDLFHDRIEGYVRTPRFPIPDDEWPFVGAATVLDRAPRCGR